MNKLLYIFVFAVMTLTSLTSCDDTETYAEQKKREAGRIGDYIRNHNISVISESKFREQGCTTDVSKNEYVLFESKGIYMQIIDKGCGELLKDGETADVLCRFKEYNVNGDSLQLSNIGLLASSTKFDKMSVTNNSGSFTASFVTGLMMSAYGSAQVPGGWLMPLTYVRIGRVKTETDKIAHVKIIVPHDQGQAYATANVYACAYDLFYERGY